MARGLQGRWVMKIRCMIVELDDGTRVELTSFPMVSASSAGTHLFRTNEVAKFGNAEQLAHLALEARATIEKELL